MSRVGAISKTLDGCNAAAQSALDRFFSLILFLFSFLARGVEGCSFVR